MILQHTKVPWKLLPSEEGVPYLRIRGTQLGDRYKIANVILLDYIQRDVIESQANAKLICAAPELLQALIKLANSYAFLKPPGLKTDAEMQAFDAIAQATGGNVWLS